MTEERLIQYMASRKSWMSYETIGRHFCVTPATAQTAIKKLEKEGRVHYKFGERGRKLWHLTDKPVAPPPPKPDPVAVPAVRVHRIEDGESRAAAKPRTKTPTQPQSWFSILGK
jgi:predicted ArsR family transcriptional regulator